MSVIHLSFFFGTGSCICHMTSHMSACSYHGPHMTITSKHKRSRLRFPSAGLLRGPPSSPERARHPVSCPGSSQCRQTGAAENSRGCSSPVRQLSRRSRQYYCRNRVLECNLLKISTSPSLANSYCVGSLLWWWWMVLLMTRATHFQMIKMKSEEWQLLSSPSA